MDAYCNRQSQNRKLDMIPTCADGNLDSIPKTHFLEQIASIFKRTTFNKHKQKLGFRFAEEVHILMATLHATLKWGCMRAIFFFHHLSGEICTRAILNVDRDCRCKRL